jgi:hypothetical protein
MKKIVLFLGFMILSLSLSTIIASDLRSDAGLESDNTAVIENAGEKLFADKVHPLELRIMEIRDMDKSGLSAEEKQELRAELRDIRAGARQPSGGVYISVGALIVVLILILLLR